MIKQLEQEWRQSQKYHTKRELLEIFPEVREYLEEEERKSLIFIDAFEMIVRYHLGEISKIEDNFTRWFCNEVVEATEGYILDKWERRLKEVTLFLNPWPIDKKGGVSDEDILQAKQIQFDALIEFNRAGKALCPFHNEKTPSFSWHKKSNTAHCFGCGKTWDTIQFIMDRDGIGFIEAVQRLCKS